MEPERIEQEQVDRCDFLDALEEAATFGRRIEVRTKDGDAFEDVVQDVVTEDGGEHVEFADHGRMRIEQVASITRAVPPKSGRPA